MVTIIDSPDFMFQDNLEIDSKFRKVYLMFFGIFIGFLHKNTHKKVFCKLMNMFFSNDGFISFSEGVYYKKIWDNTMFGYPNKRIDRIILDNKKHFEKLYETYCLSEVKLIENDLIIDCGANVGELYKSLQLFNKDFQYKAFEPDPYSFEVLKTNLKDYNIELYDYALSDSEETKNLYLNTEGADSSLIYFGKNNKTQVQTKTLDSFKFNKVKLLKLEAEGGEFEVLKGAKKTLKNIEYIAVDYGPERGVHKESTSVEIINFLYENNFRLLKVSKYRQAGLFINTAIK